MTLTVIVALAAVTAVFKAAGTAVPRLPPSLERRLGGLAPALLAALVVSEITDADGVPEFDAKLLAVGVTLLCAWRKLPFAVCVIAGAATAAAIRALT